MNFHAAEPGGIMLKQSEGKWENIKRRENKNYGKLHLFLINFRPEFLTL